MFQHTARSISAPCAVDGEVLAENHVAVKKFIVGIGTSRETVEVTVLDRSLIVVVAKREERASLLRTVADGYIILLNDTRTCNLFEPIGVTGAHRTVLIEEHVHRHLVQHRIAILIVTPVIVISQIVVTGIQTVVDACLPVGATPLAGVHGFNLISIERGSNASIEVHLHLAVLAFLGRDDNHTISSP